MIPPSSKCFIVGNRRFTGNEIILRTNSIDRLMYLTMVRFINLASSSLPSMYAETFKRITCEVVILIMH